MSPFSKQAGHRLTGTGFWISSDSISSDSKSNESLLIYEVTSSIYEVKSSIEKQSRFSQALSIKIHKFSQVRSHKIHKFSQVWFNKIQFLEPQQGSEEVHHSIILNNTAKNKKRTTDTTTNIKICNIDHFK